MGGRTVQLDSQKSVEHRGSTSRAQGSGRSRGSCVSSIPHVQGFRRSVVSSSKFYSKMRASKRGSRSSNSRLALKSLPILGSMVQTLLERFLDWSRTWSTIDSQMPTPTPTTTPYLYPSVPSSTLHTRRLSNISTVHQEVLATVSMRTRLILMILPVTSGHPSISRV